MKMLLLLILCVCSSISVTAQKISEHFCNEISASVVRPLKPLKFNINDTYSDSCWFEFTTENKGFISINVEKHNTANESHKSLQNTLSLFIEGNRLANAPSYWNKLEKKNLKRRRLSKGFWDEDYIYEEYDFALIRKQNFEITLFAQDKMTFDEIEKLLRTIKFNNR